MTAIGDQQAARAQTHGVAAGSAKKTGSQCHGRRIGVWRWGQAVAQSAALLIGPRSVKALACLFCLCRMLVPRLHPSGSTACCGLPREATELWTGVQTEESITVTCIIALVIRKEVHSSPAFEEVIEDEWEVPIQEPAAEEDVPAAPEAIPDATRHRVLQRCMTLENLETP